MSKQPPQRKSKRNVKETGDSAYETPCNYSDPPSNEAVYNYSIRRDQPLDSHILIRSLLTKELLKSLKRLIMTTLLKQMTL